jgi:hypothetical protein
MVELHIRSVCNGKINVSAPDLRAQGFEYFMKRHPKIEHGMLIQKDFCEQAAGLTRDGGKKAAFLCSSDSHAL